MSTLPVLVTRPTSPAEEVPADAELSLTALLELFAPDEPGAAPARGSLRSYAAQLGGWVRAQSRRAAAWGAVPGTTGLRGNHSTMLPTGDPK